MNSSEIASQISELNNLLNQSNLKRNQEQQNLHEKIADLYGQLKANLEKSPYPKQVSATIETVQNQIEHNKKMAEQFKNMAILNLTSCLSSETKDNKGEN